MVKHGQVVGGISLASAVLVLVHGHIQDPVETILDAPVTANRVGQLGRVRRQTAYVEPSFVGRLVLDRAFGLNNDEASQARPFVAIVQPTNSLLSPIHA